MNVVEKIHQEIDSAQDRLLSEALRTIEKNSIDKKEDKVKRLKALGFSSCESVVTCDKILRVVNESAAQAELIRYYSVKYPFLKFITNEEMKRICDKYNLIFAPVSAYVKEVPEKNLLEIENAQQLAHEDRPLNAYSFEMDFYSYVPRSVRKFFKTFEHHSDDVNDDILRKLCPIKYKGDHLYHRAGLTIHERKVKGLFIAAPKSHFNLSGLSRRGANKGFFSVISFKPEPEDPIVFRYVRGGIQILSKWGEESEDSSLTVPALN